MLWFGSGLLDDMEGKLKRDLLVWPGSIEDRNGRAESLKIQEMKWVFQPCQKGFNLLPFDVRLAGNRRRPLNFVSGGLKTR